MAALVGWYQNVFQQWPLALQLLAYVAVGLNLVIAYWLYYDTQRYNGRLNPFSWALGGLCCACLTLAVYWRTTGSPRAALAFCVTLITGVVMLGMYDRPIQQAVDLQVGHTLQQLPVKGIRGPA